MNNKLSRDDLIWLICWCGSFLWQDLVLFRFDLLEYFLTAFGTYRTVILATLFLDIRLYKRCWFSGHDW